MSDMGTAKEVDLYVPEEEILSLLKNKRLVTFEAIHTLVGPPFVSDAHLHAALGWRYGLPEFAFERATSQDVSEQLRHPYSPLLLKDIYADLSLPWEREEELFAALSRALPAGKRIYDICRAQGVEMIVLSDTFLQGETVRRLLDAHGFDAFSELRIFSETGLTKKSYMAFRTLLAERQLEPHEVLHVGHDDYNDRGVPVSMGMDALHVQPAWKGLNRISPSWAQVFSALDGMVQYRFTADSIRMMAGCLAERLAAEGVPEAGMEDGRLRAGALVIGPAFFGFAAWVAGRLERDARDVLVITGSHPDSLPAHALMGMLDLQERAYEVLFVEAGHPDEVGDWIRNLDAGRTAIVNMDPGGHPVSVLVAAHPALASARTFHLFLDKDSRQGPGDQCYLYKYGLPEERARQVRRFLPFWQEASQRPLPDSSGSDVSGMAADAALWLQAARFTIDAAMDVIRAGGAVAIEREVLYQLMASLVVDDQADAG